MTRPSSKWRDLIFGASIGIAMVLPIISLRADDWGDNKHYTNEPGMAASQAICRSVKGLTPPAADLPNATDIAALKGCSSEDLYYGETGPADPVKARKCALAESHNGRDEPNTSHPFSGPTILMMLYANGSGVTPNLDLATHFACLIDGAPSENDFRVHTLAGQKGQQSTLPGFDYCEGITSGYAQGFCAVRDSNLPNPRETAKWAALSSRVLPAATSAFDALFKASGEYERSHGDREIDISGSGRVAFMIDEQQSMHDLFATQLRQVLDRHVPAATSAQASGADKALNEAYRKLTARGERVIPDESFSAKVADVRTTQRAWIKYRDAFVTFSRAQWPGAPTSGLFAQLTRDRTRLLLKLLESGDASTRCFEDCSND